MVSLFHTPIIYIQAMNILKRTLLSVFVLVSFHAFSQGKKERIFICKSNLYEDEHTSDAKFNSLVDNACTEINQRHYKDGLRLLNEAILLDSTNTGIANEYFRAQRNKLMNFIAEEETAKSNEPATEQTVPTPSAETSGSNNPGGNTSTTSPDVKPENEKAVESAPAPDKVIAVKEETPVEKTETKTSTEGEKKMESSGGTEVSQPVPDEPKKTSVSEPEPIPEPEPAPATPAEPSVTTQTTVSTDENNAPEEVKSFTVEEKEEFHIKGEQKVKTLEGYIKQLTDKNTSQGVVDEVTENAVALFDNEERTVEVSSLNNPGKIKLKVRKYFQKLSMIPYENITIEWADFQYTSDFRMGVDGNYYGYIIFRQRFTAEQDQIIVYEDMTTKKIEVILKRYNKNIEGQAVANWDVFLGDISVEQTEKY